MWANRNAVLVTLVSFAALVQLLPTLLRRLSPSLSSPSAQPDLTLQLSLAPSRLVAWDDRF